jgi:thymidine kinase
MEHVGEIQLILGPMFSGKSTELLRRIRRYTVAKRKCLVVKYKQDTRYSQESLATHDRQQWVAVPTDKLDELHDLANAYDVIGIDEGQFFPDIVPFCEEMANRGKTIVVAALDGTFQRKPFGSVLELIPLAESVVKLTAICQECQAPAAFSKRLGAETQVELIGGADKYVAVCRRCYHEPSHVAKTRAKASTQQVIRFEQLLPHFTS